MKIISFIEDAAVIKDILRHLNLWETRNYDPPEGKIKRGYIPDNDEIPDIHNSDHQQCFDENQEFYDDDYCDRPFEDDYSLVE